MYSTPVPVGEGALWNELMGLVDPTLDNLVEATIVESPETQQGGFRVGSLRNTNEYHPRPEEEVRDEAVAREQAAYSEQLRREHEQYRQQLNARVSLHSMGFTFPKPGELIESLGGEVKYDKRIFDF
jgi:hypothetical protein